MDIRLPVDPGPVHRRQAAARFTILRRMIPYCQRRPRADLPQSNGRDLARNGATGRSVAAAAPAATPALSLAHWPPPGCSGVWLVSVFDVFEGEDLEFGYEFAQPAGVVEQRA